LQTVPNIYSRVCGTEHHVARNRTESRAIALEFMP
jgi:hypothetical protein